MRIFSVRPPQLVRALLVASLFVAAGCGGGGSTGTSPVPNQNNFGVCDPGTAVQIARPQNGDTGVSTSVGRIEIVANGNNNTLYQSYTMFDLVLVDQFSGNRITSNPLTLTSDSTGPHPYPSDFYYQGTIPGLNFGTTYGVYLNIFNSNCQQLPFLGSFST